MGLLSRAQRQNRANGMPKPARGLRARAEGIRAARERVKAAAVAGLPQQAAADGSAREALERKAFDLSNLFEISREVNGTLKLDELFTILIFTAMGQTGAQQAVLYVREHDEYTVRASRGLVEGLVLPPLDVDGTIARRLAARPEVLDAGVLEVDLIAGERRLFEIVPAQLVLPLVNKDELVAIMLLGGCYGDSLPGADGREFLMSLASMGAIALANARLYASLELKLNQLSGLYEISRVVNSSADTDEVLRLATLTLETGFSIRKAAFLGCLPDGGLDLMAGIGIERIAGNAPLGAEFEAAFTAGQALPVDDWGTSDDFLAVFGSEGAGGPALIVPLLAAGQRVGLLVLLEIEGRSARPFGQAECELFSIIGAQFAPPLLVARTLARSREGVADPFHPYLALLEREWARAAEFSLSLGVCEFSLEGLGGIKAEEGGRVVLSVVEEAAAVLRAAVDARYPLMRVGAASFAVVLAGVSLRDQERIVDDAARALLEFVARTPSASAVRLERTLAQIPEEYPCPSAWIFRSL